MTLNNQLLYHFLENSCEYDGAYASGSLSPASLIWRYKIISTDRNICHKCWCAIFIKQHTVLTVITYGNPREPGHIRVVEKVWWRPLFSVFGLVRWIYRCESKMRVVVQRVEGETVEQREMIKLS